MTVVRLTLYRYRLRFTEPLVTAHGRFTHREGLLVRLTDDVGRRGWGDAAPWPGFSHTNCEELAVLVQRNHHEIVAGMPGIAGPPDVILPILPAMIAATSELRFAIETATLDLLAQARHVPVYRLISAVTCSSLPVNALIGRIPQEEMTQRLNALVVEGFRTIKIKLGSGDVETDVDRATQARHVVGDNIALRFDLNLSWSMTDAVASLPRLAALRPEYIEEPVSCDDLPSLRDLQANATVPLALDETLTDETVARRAIAENIVQVYVLKPQFHGGFSRTASLARMVRSRGGRVVVTSALESAVGVAAAAHFAAAQVGESVAHGLATGTLFEQDVCAASLRVEEGRLRLPTGPGLGLAPDESILGEPLGEWQR